MWTAIEDPLEVDHVEDLDGAILACEKSFGGWSRLGESNPRPTHYENSRHRIHSAHNAHSCTSIRSPCSSRSPVGRCFVPRMVPRSILVSVHRPPAPPLSPGPTNVASKINTTHSRCVVRMTEARQAASVARWHSQARRLARCPRATVQIAARAVWRIQSPGSRQVRLHGLDPSPSTSARRPTGWTAIRPGMQARSPRSGGGVAAGGELLQRRRQPAGIPAVRSRAS